MGSLKDSLALIKKVAELSGPDPLIVNFSGGKDSVTCLLLALKVTKNVECLFMDSGQELPGTLEYVEAMSEKFGVPLNVSHPCTHRIKHKVIPEDCCLLPQYIRHFGYFPTTARRYCSTYLKLRPGRILCRQKWGNASLYKIVGVRRSESQVRNWKYGSLWSIRKHGSKEIRPDAEHHGSFMVFPILDWSKHNVKHFLAKEGVKIHGGYKLFGMSGCKWCPVAKPYQIRGIAQHYPGIYDELIALEEDLGKPAWQHRKNHRWLKDLVASPPPKYLKLTQFFKT